jgi:hypothetical protein
MIKNTIATLVTALSVSSVYAVSDQVINNSFNPYANGVPSYKGLTEGMLVDQSNVDQFKEILDPAMYDFIKAGETVVKVGATTSFDSHPNYIEATRKYASQTTLGEAAGDISGSLAGRPFPQEPSLDDPKAGEKIAWNFKYGYLAGDAGALVPSKWKFRDKSSGKVERELTIDAHFLSFSRRTTDGEGEELRDRPEGLWRGFYTLVHQPFDVKNTQLLLHRYEDDLKRDNGYMYLGFQRRVRRLSTGQTTDAYLGSDVMIEDFEGYNGRISDMTWTYKGTKNILLPMYKHNEMELDATETFEDGYQLIDFEGQGGCFPKVTYQLRKVYVVETDPVDPNHPISKRVHYVDAQTFVIPRTLTYDRKGDLWKSWSIAKAHPDYHLPVNKGTGTVLDDGFTMIDVQANHCTTAAFRSVLGHDISPIEMFTTQNMRSTGR